MIFDTLEAPSDLPISLGDMKEYLHVASEDEDNLIESLIRSAVAECQNSGRVCIGVHKLRVIHRARRGKARYFLPRRASSIQSVKLLFPEGVAEEQNVTSLAGLAVATSCMVWKTDSEPVTSLSALCEVEVRYTSGFSTQQLAADNADILQAVRDTVADWFENRGAGTSLPPSAAAIMKKYWTPVIQ